MAKPRTISDGIERWADSILRTLDPTDTPSFTVSSVEVYNDAIFHYGQHWPMGVIERDVNGKAKRVYVNSNSCTKSSGSGHTTDSVTSDVARAARSVAAKKNIPVLSVPMGSRYIRNERILCKPKASDPEPPRDWRCEIPTFFRAFDPGDEPVDDGIGCIAGRVDIDTYQATHYYFPDISRPLPSNAWVRHMDADGRTWRYSTDCVETVQWGAERSHWEHQRAQGDYSYSNRPAEGDIYHQCPHCAKFAAKHEAWHIAMHGPRWGRGHGKGWLLYSEMIERYGSVDEWKSERLAEFRRVRDGRKAHADWYERNSMSQSYLPNLGPGVLRFVPKLDSDGLPFRKDSEAYFRNHRKAVRAATRSQKIREREHAKRLRHQRQVERFASQMRARRGTSFTQRAANVARELAAVNAALSTTNEQESENA